MLIPTTGITITCEYDQSKRGLNYWNRVWGYTHTYLPLSLSLFLSLSLSLPLSASLSLALSVSLFLSLCLSVSLSLSRSLALSLSHSVISRRGSKSLRKPVGYAGFYTQPVWYPLQKLSNPYSLMVISKERNPKP